MLKKAADLDLDPSAGLWVVTCEDHNTLVQVPTRTAARSVKTEDFCDACRKAAEEAARPAEAPAPAPAADQPLTRKQCLALLADLGYEGPTSYLMPRLREIVAEQQAAAAKP